MLGMNEKLRVSSIKNWKNINIQIEKLKSLDINFHKKEKGDGWWITLFNIVSKYV